VPATEGKLIDGVVPEGQQYDLIITNPPYYSEILSPRVIWAGDPKELLNQRESQENFCVQFFREAPRFLNPSGSAAALISGKQTKILEEVLTYLETTGLRREVVVLRPARGCAGQFAFTPTHPLRPEKGRGSQIPSLDHISLVRSRMTGKR